MNIDNLPHDLQGGLPNRKNQTLEPCGLQGSLQENMRPEETSPYPYPTIQQTPKTNLLMKALYVISYKSQEKRHRA